jgi:hypothetical protein
MSIPPILCRIPNQSSLTAICSSNFMAHYSVCFHTASNIQSGRCRSTWNDLRYGLVQGWFHSLWSFYWYTVKLPIGGEWWWLWPSWKAWWGGAILPFPFQRPPMCWSHISRRRLSKLLLQDIIIYCHSQQKLLLPIAKIYYELNALLHYICYIRFYLYQLQMYHIGPNCAKRGGRQPEIMFKRF